jgi:UDP-2-acetamido-2,6-beta-L-arabino-hexul-4-ose reductase
VSAKTVAVTGSNGFIGRNLVVRLGELGFKVAQIARDSDEHRWRQALASADAVIHLAGANRPANDAEFMEINVGVAQQMTEMLLDLGRAIPVIYASTAKADDPSEYGSSKRLAEEQLKTLADTLGNKLYVYRLPNVFGKWARPNYNSAVATFCHNIARDIPINIHDPAMPLTLVYVDDVVGEFIATLDALPKPGFRDVHPTYVTTVGEVADMIRGFRNDRTESLIANVGTGLARALYATYVSALPIDQFSYEIVSHTDPRGSFSEMLKTREAGQFSYFTAHPGVTRGGHYHHTKTEKFLIVHGHARFRFRNILTDETHEVTTSGDCPVVVETIPGWSHDVTNVGDDTLVSLLWANELFDPEKPDTISMKVF